MKKSAIKKNDKGFYFRVDLGKDLNGKRVQKYCSGFKTKKEAISKYAEVVLMSPNEVNDGKESLKYNDTTFGEYIEEIFLPWYKTQIKNRTFENRLYVIRKHFTYFYDFKLCNITAVEIQKWQTSLIEKYSVLHTRAIYGLLSFALERAIVLDLLDKNYAKVVGNVRKKKIKIEFWTKEEFEKFISALNLDDYDEYFLFILVWTLFMTGMRIGELCALHWNDLDLKNGVISINKTLYYRNSKNFAFVEPKTKASVREVAIDDATLSYIVDWREMQAKKCVTELIFSVDGSPTQRNTVSRLISKVSACAGVQRIRTHALRHSHASLLISMGENPLLIKERLGHEDIETTLGTYGHLYPNTNFELAKKLNGIIKI